MDLSTLFHSLFGQQPEPSGPPQAYTRVTRTPVRWGQLDGDTYGQYSPGSGAITMNQDLLPQSNANPEYMSNILRHESVHALLPQQSVAGITSYFNSNPQDAQTGRENLAKYAPDAASTNKGLAQEAPAYAVQGYRFGLPSERIITEYLKHMPEPIRLKYLQLLRSGAGSGAQ